MPGARNLAECKAAGKGTFRELENCARKAGWLPLSWTSAKVMKAQIRKSAWKVLALGLAGSLGCGVCSVRADLEVYGSVSIHSTADFYEPLAASGTWIEFRSYGRCWHPTAVAVGWRPYCAGHWVWTDCGWYWASDEPWGWACYHYGTWVYDPEYSWVWVPGVEWAPAWVSWRVGGGYIGWAPLAPHGVVVAAPEFVFVTTSHFTEPVRASSVVINNTTIIKETKVVNNMTRESKDFGGGVRHTVIVNQGPGLTAFDATTARRIHKTPIQDAARQAPLPSHLRSGAAKAASVEKPANAGQERPRTAPAQPTPAHETRGQNVRPTAPPEIRNTQPPEQNGRGQGAVERKAVEPGTVGRGAGERGAVERGTVGRGAGERGAVEKGAAEAGRGEKGNPEKGKGDKEKDHGGEHDKDQH